MSRWLLAPLIVLTFAMHTPASIPIVKVLVVNQAPLTSFSLSVQRDSLVARAARKAREPMVPVWLALSIAHAENWGGDSTAVNPFSGAIGLGQIHPVNFGRFPECGENILNRHTNVCYMIRILQLCKAGTLALTLNCYGGAVSLAGKRAYNLDVARKMRLDWLD